jgi:hypothetical protein
MMSTVAKCFGELWAGFPSGATAWHEQLGDVVLVEPQHHRNFSGSQASRETTTIEEEGLFLAGNGFLRVEHDPEYGAPILTWCSRLGAIFQSFIDISDIEV